MGAIALGHVGALGALLGSSSLDRFMREQRWIQLERKHRRTARGGDEGDDDDHDETDDDDDGR